MPKQNSQEPKSSPLPTQETVTDPTEFGKVGETPQIAASEEPKNPGANIPDYPSIPAAGINEPQPLPAPRINPFPDLEDYDDTTKTFKGSKSTERINAADRNHVVVDQWQIGEANGGTYEVPNTKVRQTYDPVQYQKLVDSGFFSDSRLGVKVLHQPKK